MKNKKTTKRAPILADENTSTTSTSASRVGSLLKKRREELKISMEKASQLLCIRKSFIKAIEEGETESLPERVYTFGFVGSYASFLDLDKDSILREYQKENNASKDPDFISFPDPLPKKGTPSYVNYLIGLLIIALGIGLWITFNSGDPSVDENTLSRPSETLNLKDTQAIEPAPSSPLLPQENAILEISSLPVDDDKIPSSTDSIKPLSKEAPLPLIEENAHSSSDDSLLTPPPPSSPEILLTAKERVWVQITNASGVPSFTKVMKPGEFYKLPATSDAYLTIGNAGGLEISVDNKAIPSLGVSGQVIRNFSLNAQKLLEKLSSEAETA
ncbi:MAG TPA: DUF4115 domain-containing protein [Alphaproteobacteria bacterium]|nr:DUF4115 domain-containing protein [Alphaproteobacteria bacterium]HQS93537.1 DUF4115 domain-containing protein [Alphaproteobacteria bacterium]